MSAPAPSMFSKKATSLIEAGGLQLGRPNLDIFAQTTLQLAQADRDVLVVTSDSRGSGKLKPFGEALPDQIIEMGIAEQNLVGVAAGLASTGKKVLAVSPACFLSARALEQIKNDVAYSDNPVTLVGISAGVSYGALGSTHHSLHDLAALRAINNLNIIVPADNFETAEAVKQSVALNSPVYLRFGKAAQYGLPGEAAFSIGKARCLRKGGDILFIATGEAVIHAWLAAQVLQEENGLESTVLSVPSIRPLDAEAILESARSCKAVVTAEEHMVNGGLGEACASLLLEAGVCRPFRRVGIPDEYTVTGSQADIFRHYGISMEGLSQTALELLQIS